MALRFSRRMLVTMVSSGNQIINMDEEDSENSGGKILLACTGSVASIKVPMIVEELLKLKFDVRVVATEKALHFFDRTALSSVHLYEDKHEWEDWNKIGDPVLHIELRRWADMMVIAPLDANTLAKIVHGICDNLLTCTVRAWDTQKPLYFAPAMNTYMWEHPITAPQIEKLKEFGYKELPPVVKKLACGDYGAGAMAEVNTIVSAVFQELSQRDR